MMRSRWLLLGMAAALMLGFFAGPASAAKTLTFSNQPADAVKGQAITTVALDALDGTLSGDSIQVLAASNTRVTLTSVPASSLSKTVRADGNGVATFTNISIGAPGTYVLRATASGSDPATSNSFRVFDAGKACDSSSPLCDPSTGVLTNKGMTAKVAGTSTGSGVVAVSLGIESAPVCPGDGPQYNHGPSVVSSFWNNINGEIVITMTISKAWDQQQSNNGASFYQVCFTYDIAGKTFTDKFGTPNVTTGLLPDCGPKQGPPCVQSKSKDQKGNVLIVIRVLEDAKCH